MILQIYDEPVFEIPEKELTFMEPLIKQRMETVIQRNVPPIVQTAPGRNWA